MSEENRASSFDELARGLASGNVSRGKALRLMGAALVGGTLASIPGVAWAAKGGRSSCAKFCQSLFGANTPEEAECVSQGTKGQGPCYTCTTSTGCGPNFTKPTCVTGQTYNCSTCRCPCPSGTTPCRGQCVSTTCPEGQVFDPDSCECVCAVTPCPEGQFYNFGTCQCAPVGQCPEAGQCIAGGGVFPACAPYPFNCICVGSVEGAATCAAGGFLCEDFPPCESTAECEAQFGSGYFCQAPDTGCCGQICVPPCGAGTTTLGASSTGKTNAG